VAQSREPQYKELLDLRDRQGLTPLGLATNVSWHDDPKRLAFTFARYKFVAKMFSGMQRVLEAGCGDAFGTRIVRQEVPYVMAVDFDPLFIEDVRQRMDPLWSFDCAVHDMLSGPVPGGFDGVYSLDVLEHIRPEDEGLFMSSVVNSLVPHGAAIICMPSLEAQAYATPRSRTGHVNCKTAAKLKELLEQYFYRVFIFSMNDEIVHTGFYPMACYLMGLCCERK
jgi:SAM-dependent methyltransferase